MPRRLRERPDLWQQFLRYDPSDPRWPNRDRFVLSAGHASMLLYALLHLAGVRRVEDGRVTDTPAVSLDDIKNFRQLDSVTPGHPEYGHTTGVETTTGPLGQGCGNSVGRAIASRWLTAHYNRPNATVFDFDVYTICSDGDMMEGVASEAASLAGHLRLSNLCWIYDSNTVTIEGHTDLAMSEDVAARFKAYHWNVLRLQDANDTAGFAGAVEISRHQTSPHADNRRQHHRLRRAAQAEYRRRAQRRAWQGRGAARQTVLRLAGRRAIPGARGGVRRVPTALGGAAAPCARSGSEPLRATKVSIRKRRAKSNCCCKANCRSNGIVTCRLLQRTRRVWRRPNLPEKYSTPSPKPCLG